MESVAARVKDAGMRFGLWMGFGQAHPVSKVAREHPEWLVTRGGTPLVGGWNLPILCLGYPPCRDWVLQQVSGVVERFGVEWLKHDFDLIPVSDAHHHAPLASDTRIESVQGYYHILERLHERFPRLYVEWEDAGTRTTETGAALMGSGVSVRIPRCFGSEVLRLRRS